MAPAAAAARRNVLTAAVMADPGQCDLPQFHRGAGAGHQEGDHLRPVQDRDLLGDVAGIQQPGRPPAGVAVPGAQVQQGDQQRQLVGGGAAAGVDDLQQSLGEPALAPPGPGWFGITDES